MIAFIVIFHNLNPGAHVHLEFNGLAARIAPSFSGLLQLSSFSPGPPLPYIHLTI